MAPQSWRVGVTQPNGKAAAKKAVRNAIWYIVNVSVDSVAVMPRTPTVTVPNRIALASANSDPAWNVPMPGEVTSNTPRKPMISAPQRTGPTISLRNTTDATVAKRGAEKLIATALASGIRLNAMTRKVCAHAWETLRSVWSRSRLVRNTASPVTGRITRLEPTSAAAARMNSIWPTG